MGPNLLSSIINIVQFHDTDLTAYSKTSAININNVGVQLEYYLKDSIAKTFSLRHKFKEEKYPDVFSWLGNTNNPPDFIIRGGDAYEIKKLGTPNATIQLNNVHPKNRFYSTDPRITNACRECEPEPWDKDMIYVVGYTSEGKIKHLNYIQGECYAADKEVYERIEKPIRLGVENASQIAGLETAKTRELGRISRADPLGITQLRVRGMWLIENPRRVFTYVFKIDDSKDFNLSALVTCQKYQSYCEEERQKLESIPEIRVEDVKIKDPNNPANRLDAKLIRASW